MRSRLPKALHAIGGRTLLAHVLSAAMQAGGGDIAVVVGPDHDAVAAEARALAPKAKIFEQTKRRGTAHAVLAARKAIARGADDILVMFADTPLVRPETLRELRAALARGAAVAVLGFQAGESDRLWPAADARRRARWRSARNATPARGTQDRALQWRADGACRRHRARHPRPHRQRQCQGRILSHRRGCHRPRYGLEGGRDRNRGGRRARDQYQGAARRNRGGAAAAPARRRARCRRHHDRAGDGVSVAPTPNSARTSRSSRMWCSGPASRSRTAR